MTLQDVILLICNAVSERVNNQSPMINKGRCFFFVQQKCIRICLEPATLKKTRVFTIVLITHTILCIQFVSNLLCYRMTLPVYCMIIYTLIYF